MKTMKCAIVGQQKYARTLVVTQPRVSSSKERSATAALVASGAISRGQVSRAAPPPANATQPSTARAAPRTARRTHSSGTVPCARKGQGTATTGRALPETASARLSMAQVVEMVTPRATGNITSMVMWLGTVESHKLAH